MASREVSFDQCESIHPALASRVAQAVVGHVLYARGQIPYPMKQLAALEAKPRQSPAQARATRKKNELVESYDALDVDLSSALQEISRLLASPSALADSAGINIENAVLPLLKKSLNTVPSTDKVHILVFVGNSLTTPKSRMLIEIDGFDIRPLGWHVEASPLPLDSFNTSTCSSSSSRSVPSTEVEDITATLATTSLNPTAAPVTGEDEQGFSDVGNESDMSIASMSSHSDMSIVEDDESSDERSAVSSASSVEQSTPVRTFPVFVDSPSSGSPRGSGVKLIPRSSILTPKNIRYEAVFEAPLDSTPTPTLPTFGVQKPSPQTPIARPPLAALPIPRPALSPSSTVTQRTPSLTDFASEPFLRQAERLVLRTLASAPTPSTTSTSSSLQPSSSIAPPTLVLADEEDTELPLSETLILLRAPREGFEHEKFVPRQTASHALDLVVDEALASAGKPREEGKKKGWGKKVKTEVLRVRCAGADAVSAQEGQDVEVEKENGDGDEEENESEMIWYQWTGKLRGISDEVLYA